MPVDSVAWTYSTLPLCYVDECRGQMDGWTDRERKRETEREVNIFLSSFWLILEPAIREHMGKV